MNITVSRTRPPTTPPTCMAPPSKSDAHRLLILSALSDSTAPIPITLSDTNADIDATVASLIALGANIKRSATGFHVRPIPRGDTENDAEIQMDVGESGSTLRFLLPVIGALSRRVCIRMHGRLPHRPLFPLDTLLSEHGMTLARDDSDETLLHISGTLTPGEFTIDSGVSSQFISGLLFALPLLPAPSVLRITGTVASAPYIDLTRSALKRFGFAPMVTENGHCYEILPTAFHPTQNLSVEGDWSGSAFLLCAGALTRGVTVSALRRDSVQGDRRILDVLRDTGCTVQWNGAGDTVTLLPPENAPLSPFSVSADDIPDLVPPLAALACGCHGACVISDCARLRIKESDRLAATLQMVQDLGGCAAVSEDDRLTVFGTGALSGGCTPGSNDHRMVMSAALCALISDRPVTVSDREAIRKSYPGFFDDLSVFGIQL